MIMSKSMATRICRTFLPLTLSLLMALQTGFAGGSVYSRYGFGDILFFGSNRTYAMGGASIALISDGFINRFNPAGLSKISLTRFSGGFEYSNFSSRSDLGSSTYAKGSIQGAAIAVPLSKENGVVLSLEETPYSLVDYAVQHSDSQAGITSQQNFYGSGGLSALAIGVSWSVSPNLHLGTKIHYLFGRTRQYVASAFTDPTYANNQVDRSTFHRGFSLTGGAILEHVGDVVGVRSLSLLSLGLVCTLPTTLKVQEARYYSAIDTTINDNGNADIPLSIGLGLSYVASERYQYVADVYTQRWGSANYLGSHPAELKDNVRVSGGVEILPDKNADTYLTRTLYRAGFFYQSTYYKVNGQPIDELFLTGGVGLPLSPDTRLNIGLQLGTRGTTANGLQRDTVFRLSFSISGSEAWFMKYEEE